MNVKGEGENAKEGKKEWEEICLRWRMKEKNKKWKDVEKIRQKSKKKN